jgi:hypothetical protein
MKYLLTLLFSFFVYFGFSQSYYQRSYSSTIVGDSRLKANLNFAGPHYPDTSTANQYIGKDSIGGQITTGFNPIQFWLRDSANGIKFWTKIQGGGGADSSVFATIYYVQTQFDNRSTLADYGILDAVRNAGNAVSWQSGTFVNRPSAASAGIGAFYAATDSLKMYLSNGTSWLVYGGSGGSSFGLQNIQVQSGMYAYNDSTIRLGFNPLLEDIHMNGENNFNWYFDSLRLFFTSVTTISLDTSNYKLLVVNNSTKEIKETFWQLPINPPFSDNASIIKNNSDNTKQLIFSASLISTSTTRTWTFPDVNGTVARNDAGQTFTGVQTFSSSPNLSSLTASRPLQLDASKNITASAIDLSVATNITNGLLIANGGAPSGGNTGQVLTKNSNASYDYGWASTSGGAPFADNAALVKNNSDNTKLLIFSAASITTGTTRTWTFPDVNGTVARNDAAQTFTGVQTFSSNPIFSSITNKSVIFATTSGAITDDNSNFQYDNSTHHLMVGIHDGSNSASGNLTLNSTSSGTKGFINFGANSSYDETNNRLGISNTAPQSRGEFTTANIGGSTATIAQSLIASNNTAAVLNAQQWSPGIIWLGHAWHTTGSADGVVAMMAQLQTIQGTSQSTGNLQWTVSVQGGGFANMCTMTSSGSFFTNNAGTASSMSIGLGGGLVNGFWKPTGNFVNVGINSADIFQFSASGASAGSGLLIGWSASTAPGTTGVDLAFARNGSGVIEGNSGTKGTYAGTKLLIGKVQTNYLSQATQTTATTKAAGTGAGTGPTITLATGSGDLSGQITVLTGTSPTASGVVVTVTFGDAAYTHASIVQLVPLNAAALALSGNTQVITAGGTASWTITAGSTNLTATTTYIWGYNVVGY